MWETDPALTIESWTTAMAARARDRRLESEHPGLIVPGITAEEKKRQEEAPNDPNAPLIGDVVSFEDHLYKEDLDLEEDGLDISAYTVTGAMDRESRLHILRVTRPQTVKVALKIEGVFARLDLDALIQTRQTMRFL